MRSVWRWYTSFGLDQAPHFTQDSPKVIKHWSSYMFACSCTNGYSYLRVFGQWHFGCMCMIWNGQGYWRNPFLTVLNRYTFPGLRACFICGYHAAVGELYCTLKWRRAVLRTTSKLRCDTLCADCNIGWLWNIFHAFFLFLSWFTQTTKNSFATKIYPDLR